MSTTGGRNRKRSDVNRTATRRQAAASADEGDRDTSGVTTPDPGDRDQPRAGGATALDTTTDSDSADGTGLSAEVDEGDAGQTTKKPLSERAQRREAKRAMRMGNPAWFIPVMLGLFILGLVWIVVFYLSQLQYPIPGITYWNLVIGFGLLMLGFAMTTRWK